MTPGSALMRPVFVLALLATPVSAVPAKVTVDDLMKLRTIFDAKISPDGERVAYVVSTPSVERDEHIPALFIVSQAGGAPSQLAANTRIFNVPLPAPRLRWSPDGTQIAFLGLAGDRPQVFAVPISGGGAYALTDAPEGVFAYEWAPDGKSLAYVTQDSPSADEARRRQDKSFVIEVDRPEPVTRLWVKPLDGRSGRVLTPAAQYVNSLSWSPDGRDIAYSASTTTGFMSPYFTRIYSVSISGGAPRVVVDQPGMNTSVQYSPNGRFLAFISTGGRTELMAPRGLSIVPVGDGANRMRAFGLDGAWIGEYVWAPDGRSIYFVATEGTFASGAHMFEQPVARVWIDDGRAEVVAGGATVNYSLSVSRDGARLAYRAVEGRTMGDLVVRDVTLGQVRKLTDVNPELRDLDLGALKPIRWRSFDGMEIWGLLLTPPQWNGRSRLPMLVYCHGGPIGGVTLGLFPQFMHTAGQVDLYPTEAMASAGFAVFFPMPRGGSGYGEAGHRAIVNGWGEADYKDIMAGVDSLVADGIADPDRLGVMGASYGGYMTNWIVTQTSRFKAASAGASLTDLTDEYYLSEGGDFMVEYFKRPWEARESYAAHSPLTYAANVTTPLLLQHGERDPRVPIAGAWKFYRTLKALGKTVEFEIYPRGGHVLYEPALEREQMRRNLEWFTRWLKPGGAGSQ
jgi:dipeptidyl aminopeptidase/acylaminoacyl peptidase